jgi:hypothetical protein
MSVSSLKTSKGFLLKAKFVAIEGSTLHGVSYIKPHVVNTLNKTRCGHFYALCEQDTAAAFCKEVGKREVLLLVSRATFHD